ncbi:MAG TPA: ABC transporter permease [Candidatus Acidoferrales bacterium]|jgi:putative ABC transport system permease protein|nr:ABC transporter permease [Candidatus Acidoferrales bacterium]
METLLQDIKYGWRMLVKSPGFTAIAVIALALGIGANTAIFSIADAFLLKPINIPDPEHLTIAGEIAPQQTDGIDAVSAANFADWKQQLQSFESMGTYQWDEVNLTGVGLPEKVQGFQVSSNIFALCNVQPIVGRLFSTEEEQPGNDGVVLLSQRLWERHFGADPTLIGKDVHIDGRPFTVIGILPRKFDFPLTAELWVPLAMKSDQWNDRKSHMLFVLGKLKPGATLASANAELHGIAQRLAAEYPATNRGWGARAENIRIFELGEDTRNYTLVLMGAVGFLLLIVCANVANLQFVRSASRQKEMAIRTALGGSRWRVVRQLLTESVITAMGGAALGLLFAYWSIRVVLRYMPPEIAKYIPGWYDIRLDDRALVFTIVAAAVAGVLAGVLPAIQSARVNVNETLKEGGRSSSGARGRHLLRNVLVVMQVFFAVVLLIGATLFARGFRNLIDFGSAFQPESLLTMRVQLPDVRYATPQQQRLFFDQALERLSALPGVQSVAETSWIPYGNGGARQQFLIQDKPWRDASEIPTADSLVVSSSYLQMMHIPLIRGREFTDHDGTDTERICVISQSLAGAFFAKEDPIGHQIKITTDNSPNPWMRIVGVVGNVKMDWTDRRPTYAFYRPYKQLPRDYGSFALRTSGDPMALATASKAAIAAVDGEIPLADLMPMSKVISNSVVGLAYVSVMMSAVAGLALLLAAIGVYGVMAFTVMERTHEIGIRMALGAQPGSVLRLIVGGGLLLAAVGLAVGLPVGLGFSYLLASLIFGIGSGDPATYIGVSLALLSVTAAACWIPARRAMRVDPIVALRYE